MDEQWEIVTSEELAEIKEAMQKGSAEGIAMINWYLERQKNMPLNIAITGECGSGKSSFVNAFRGIKNGDEGAAPTGVVETTKDVTKYPHPSHPNVSLWDLPGVGTVCFPADRYLEIVGFKTYDFFIIVTATRFKENDVKLAKEIKRMGKKFYFLRSKIDSDLWNEERSQANFNRQRTLRRIREDCVEGLRDQGIEDPQVFLVSSFELHQFDFPALAEKLETELPRHLRNAFLYAMPIVSLEIVKKKKDAYQAWIKYHAAVSSLGAAVPLPGFSTAVDLALVTCVVIQYTLGFGLDPMSLKRLADTSGVPYADLLSVITSELAGVSLTRDVVQKVLGRFTTEATLLVAEEASRFFLFIGIPAAMGLSAYTTYRILTFLLNLIADDAQKVFEMAVLKNTEV